MTNIAMIPNYRRWIHYSYPLNATVILRNLAAFLQAILDIFELFMTYELRLFLGLGMTALCPELGRMGKEGYLKKATGK